MKLNYKNVKLTQLVLFVTANLFLVSCGTYQSVYNDDGIYGDTTPKDEEKKVIVVDEKEYQDYEENYFSKKLENLQNIDNNEIFTDVDDYYYDDGLNNGEFSDENSSYNGAQPWGYEDNNVVVNINLMNNPFWGGGFNSWGWGANNRWAFNSIGWGYNNWRWRRGFIRPWGFSTWGRTYANSGFVDPYSSFWNGGYLNPFLPNFGITGFRNNRYNNINRGFRYGRRNVIANNTRRNNTYTINRNNSNGRVTKKTGRRNTNTIKRNTNTTRSNVTPTNRRGTTINRKGSTSSRRSSNIGRSNSNSRNSRASSSGNSSRSSSKASTSRSSSRSSSSSRSTSSRGSSSKRGN